MKIHIATLLAAIVAAGTPLSAQVSSPVTPFGTFGPQPTLTFGGSGISNTAVMSNTVANQNQVLDGTLLGLSATPRFDNAAFTNDGNGTFFAMAGTDQHAPSPANPYALWNFDFAITGPFATNYIYRLWYDFNPAANNVGDYGYVTLPPSENSWNLGMDFLAASIAGILVPPSFGPFDPNALGEYGFALVAYNPALVEIGRAAILVNVGDGSGLPEDVVPEPATMTLLATGLVGMVAARRRKQAKPV